MIGCNTDQDCSSGTLCNERKICVPIPSGFKDCRRDPDLCLYGSKCNETTGKCEGNGTPPIPTTLNCSNDPTVCMLGTKCNKTTGKCEGQGTPDTNICDSQEAFNHAFYKALKYTRKKDDKKISGVLAVYLFMHTIFLIWGIVLAFKSQPPQNRVVHVTLAIVFAPAYCLAYYLNLF